MHKDNKRSDGKVIKHTTADGRMVYDIASLIRSPEAGEHFKRLNELADKGLIPKPKSSTPDES